MSPDIGYDPLDVATLVNPWFRFPPGSNLLSNPINPSLWAGGGGDSLITSITDNTVTAPDGKTTGATLVVPNSGFCYNSVANNAAALYTGVLYMKGTAGRSTGFRMTNNAGTITGVVTVTFTGGWQRAQVTATMDGSQVSVEIGVDNRFGDTLAQTVFIWNSFLTHA